MEKNKIGVFSSWEIINEDLAIKHCDKSFFKHHGSGIPIETRWFWKAEDLHYPNRIDIVLKYKGLLYQAYVEQGIHGRTRIFWHQDLSKELNLIPFNESSYPSLFIHRHLDFYEIDFHNLDYIINENNDLESIVSEPHKEGKTIKYYTTKYERNATNRKLAICAHGTKCMVCGFDFEKVYGELGKDFIEVHHVMPLSNINEEKDINPITDLVCVCANCHRMLHRHKDSILTIEELKKIIKKHTL